MSAKWLTTLVRARQSQVELATQRLAAAQRADNVARQRVHRAGEHLDGLQDAEHDSQPVAFVAAMVALQSAASTHAAAVGAARSTDSERARRQRGLELAATAQFTAEELLDRANREDAAHASRTAQRELDEAGAALHRRARPGGVR